MASVAADQARLVTRLKRTHVCIVYPADPLGVIPGGVDTFIRGIVRWAPSDIRVQIVGVTTDAGSRSVDRWTTCRLGDRSFQFYAVLALKNSEKQARIPVTIRFLFSLLRRKVRIDADLIEFHRIEPCLAFLRDQRPKTLVMHQNMKVLHDAGSDIRWKYLPKLYFLLEKFLLPRMDSIYCVRDDAVTGYKAQFPALSNRIHFTPTWVDTEIFQPVSAVQRQRGRKLLVEEFSLSEDHFLLITVGRLDRQKNPLLLMDAFRLLYEEMPDIRLVFVGDGVLRRQIEDRIAHYKLKEAVRLCGVKPPLEVRRYLQTFDIFVLSSAYEGMPMSVLEALGSGLPVVSTNVGEVARVVHPGVNGELVGEHGAKPLADAIARCRQNIQDYKGEPCTDAVKDYTPQKILEPIYQNYRRLASDSIK